MARWITRAAFTCGAVLTTTFAHAGQAPATAPAAATSQAPRAAPACSVSEDAAFGVTREKPIRVGGGAFTVGARERAYLDSLRGPNGQALTYKRRGSDSSAGGRPMDIYEVTYPELPAPIVLWLDAYHFDNPRAPLGLSCVAFRLGPPPLDPFLATDLRVALALAQATQASASPIPLLDAAGALRGVALDRSRRLAIEARSAARSAGAPDAGTLMRELPRLGLLLVAHPLTCGDRSIAPKGIEVVPPQGPAPRSLGEPATGDTLEAWLGEATSPPGSMGATLALESFRPGDRVRMTFAEPDCQGMPTTMVIPLRFTPQRPLSLPRPSLPAGMTGPVDPVWLQAVVDVNGSFQQVTYIGGPESLLGAATEAVKTWKAEPARVNGVPIVGDTLLLVQFQTP